jgi:hypothetical protein
LNRHALILGTGNLLIRFQEANKHPWSVYAKKSGLVALRPGTF